MKSQDIRSRMGELHDSLEGKFLALSTMTVAVNELDRKHSLEAAVAARKRKRDADQWLEQRERAVDSSRRAAESAALTKAQSFAESSAPGPLGLAWTAPDWAAPNIVGSGGVAVRIGAFSGQLDGVPAIAPLLKPGLWVVDAEPVDFWLLQSSLLLRFIAAFGPGGVRARTWDPDFRSFTGAFGALGSLDDACVPSAISGEAEFVAAVDALLKELRTDADRLLSRGFATASEAAAEGDEAGVPLRVLFVGGPPPSRDERVEASFERLIGAANNQNVLIIAMDTAFGKDRAFPRTAGSDVYRFRISPSDGSVVIDGFPDLPILFEKGPEGRELVELINVLVNRKATRALPKLSLVDLLETDDFEKWIDEGTEGIEAVIGRAGSRPLTVALRSSNPPTPNCLIGGAVGQGKTNLLLALIHSLADRYSPLDVEMVLLDLKDGVEFNVLGPGSDGDAWLPHLRSLGLAFDIDYVLSVLTWATGELERRSTLFREAQVSSLAAFRRAGKGGLPRIVIVIDEFHRMFENEDERSQRAVGLLEHLSRTGRSAGVHMVLSSQTTSGIPALAAKSSAIFTQYHTRVSLKNSPEESQAILSAGNTAAAELDNPGEVIVNDDLGRQERNIRGQVAFATDLELRNIREKLFRQGAGAPPAIFNAQAPAVWDVSRLTELARASGEGVIVSPGRLVSLDNDPELVRVPPATGNVGVIGSNRTLVHAVLGSMLLSAAILARDPMKITVLNGLTEFDTSGPWLVALTEELERLGCVVRIVAESEVADWIVENSGILEGRTSDLVVPLAIDTVPALLRPGTDFRTPMEKFGELMAELPRQGSTVIGWWDSVAAVSRASMQPDSLFHTVCLAGSSMDDIRAFCGPFHTGPSNPWRSIVVSPGAPATARMVVPYDLEDMGLPR